MQHTPARILFALRPDVPLALLLGSAISTVVFTATPFLLPAIAGERQMSVGLVGLISTAQLGGFVIAAWGAGRFLRPARRILVAAAVLGLVVNLVSALAPAFVVLLAARFLSGIAIGLIDWVSWSEVFGDPTRIGSIAVMGPLMGTVAAPLLAVLIDVRGSSQLFVVLGLLHLVPLVFVRRTAFRGAGREREPRHRPTRGAAVVLVCLGLMTLGGSSVFVYAGAIGLGENAMPAFAVSLAFSVNALAGVPSARFRGRRRLGGAWVLSTAVVVGTVAIVHVPAVFVVSMAFWGFAFWMGVPGAFNLLASRSRYPDERAGDAQAIMAFGRVLGPLLGGVMISVATVEALGVVAAALVALSGLGLVAVELRSEPIPAMAQIRRRVPTG